MSSKKVSGKALSKVNLFLRICGGPDKEGYHEIETLFLPLESPFDRIEIEPLKDGAGIELLISGSRDVPGAEENIAYRAAAKFAEAAGIKPAWKITLEKNIPVAAGLGGGSSDAALVLKLLERLEGPLPGNQIAGIAGKLGADVPFFLDPRPSIGRGRGEILSPVPCTVSLHLLLACPEFPVSSAWAYANFAETRMQPLKSADQLGRALSQGDIDRISEGLFNDLAPALLEKFPLLRMIEEEMLESDAPGVLVSGSGPVVFALCKNSLDAEMISTRLEEKFSVCCFNSVSKI